MIEDYCSFETAMLLKEKGFDAEIKTYWWVSKVMGDAIFEFIPEPRNHDISNSEGYLSFNCRKTSLEDEVACIAPTLQMAMKWLREVHNIHICVRPYNPELPVIIGDTPYTCDIGDTKHSFKYGHLRGTWDTYEKAAEAAIKYCLENLIK